MNINSFGFSTPRALALSTVAATLTLGVVSGVFSTFSPTLIVGQTCAGYGYAAGYGYGYDCVAPVVAVAPVVNGGGSSSSSVPTTTPVVTTTTPTVSTTMAIIAKDLLKSPYKAAIETLIRAGVMNNAVTIAPTRSISRAEFLKLLSVANGYKTPVVVTKKFGDLPTTNSLINYVNYGVSMGWVNVKNSNFRPNDIITQGEIDKLIATIKKTATADTVAKPSSGVARGKAASDIVVAFFSK